MASEELFSTNFFNPAGPGQGDVLKLLTTAASQLSDDESLVLDVTWANDRDKLGINYPVLHIYSYGVDQIPKIAIDSSEQSKPSFHSEEELYEYLFGQLKDLGFEPDFENNPRYLVKKGKVPCEIQIVTYLTDDSDTTCLDAQIFFGPFENSQVSDYQPDSIHSLRLSRLAGKEGLFYMKKGEQWEDAEVSHALQHVLRPLLQQLITSEQLLHFLIENAASQTDFPKKMADLANAYVVAVGSEQSELQGKFEKHVQQLEDEVPGFKYYFSCYLRAHGVKIDTGDQPRTDPNTLPVEILVFQEKGESEGKTLAKLLKQSVAELKEKYTSPFVHATVLSSTTDAEGEEVELKMFVSELSA